MKAVERPAEGEAAPNPEIRPDPSAAAPEQPRERGIPDDQQPMLYCPVCSRKLTELKCKLLCERCGYYMSCADYY